MEKFNFNNIGTNYTILDKDTKETDSIRVIDAGELYAVIGEYKSTDYTYTSYHIAELLKGFSNFVRSPHHITWYSAYDKDFDLSAAILQAKKEGNNILVTEVLQEIDGLDKRV